MKKNKRRIACIGVIVALLILLAVLLRYLAVVYKIMPIQFGLIRSFLFIGLLGAWGISVWRRIVQRQIRRWLLSTAALTVFWMAIRTAKYHFVYDPTVLRYIWYAYYIPMLFIPLMAVLVALSIGKVERSRLPKWTALFYVPTAALVLLVLTNDFHQLVFTFPPGTSIWTDKLYIYNICYWIIVFWIVGCTAAALVIMLLKCRVPQSRRFLWLPLLPFSVSLLYGIVYALNLSILTVIAGDLPAVLCLFFTAFFECCIQCGLIQCNTGYELLFPASTACMQIVDKNYSVVYSSTTAMDIPISMLRQTQNGVVELNRDTLMKGKAIRGGYVVWYEDISELVDTIEKLKENQEEIAHANDVDRENYNTKRLISRLREKNRLYDLVQEQTAKQVALLHNTLDEYHQEQDESQRRALLAKAAVLGAYIKRRGNLVLLREQNEQLPIAELYLCLNESIQSLSIMSITCGHTIKLEGTLASNSVIRIFDLFESVIEAALGGLSGIWIHISGKIDAVAVHIEAVSDCDLSGFAFDGVNVSHWDDGTWSFSLELPKGGLDT